MGVIGLPPNDVRGTMTRASARAAPLAKATVERGRLAAPQTNLAEIKAAEMRDELVEAAAVVAEWVSISLLRTPMSCIYATMP